MDEVIDYIPMSDLEASESRVAELLTEIEDLQRLNLALREENKGLQEDLYCANEAYDSLDRIHIEVVTECNDLSDKNAILRQDLDDTTEELDACMAELDIALDALTEAGLLPQTEADDLKARFN